MGLRDAGCGGFDLRSCDVSIGLGRVNFGLGDELSFCQRACSSILAFGIQRLRFGLGQISLRCHDVGARLLDGGLKQLRINLGDGLALRYWRVEIDIQVLNAARDLIII